MKKYDHRALFRGDNWPIDFGALKAGCDHKFQTLYASMLGEGSNAYNLDRVETAIFYLRSILERHSLSGRDKVCVEVGCGLGNKAFAINDLFKSYIGIDTQEDQIQLAAQRANTLKATNTTFIAANAADVFRSPSQHALPSQIDLLMLYAVIEHLLPEERVEIFAIVDKVISGGGHVIIMETPNRLVPFDSHTTGSHFMNWLPDELAYKLMPTTKLGTRFALPDSQLDIQARQMAIYRAGRGISFHDFSDGLQHEITQYGFPMNSYSCECLSIDPIQNQEIQLFGYLDRHDINIPASVFSRSWVEAVLSSNPSDTARTTYLSPWWPAWSIQDSPPLFWHAPSISLGQQRICWEAEPNIDSSGEILVLFTGHNARLSIHLNGNLIDEFEIEDVASARPSRYSQMLTVAYLSISAIRSIRVSCLHGEAQFHGVFIHAK